MSNKNIIIFSSVTIIVILIYSISKKTEITVQSSPRPIHD